MRYIEVLVSIPVPEGDETAVTLPRMTFNKEEVQTDDDLLHINAGLSYLSELAGYSGIYGLVNWHAKKRAERGYPPKLDAAKSPVLGASIGGEPDPENPVREEPHSET